MNTLKTKTIMKRKLLLIIASLFAFGSINAQENHWYMNSYDYADARPFIGKVLMNGEIQSTTDIEIAAFVGEQVRAVSRLVEIAPSVLPGQYFIWFNIKYNNSGEAVTFKIYDHATETEYDNYTATVGGNPVSIVTGMDNPGSPSVPVMVDFVTSQTFTKTITAHTPNGGWHLIASPLDSETSPEVVDGMLNNSFDLYRFNQSAPSNDQGITLEWENWKNQSEEHYHFNLEPGKGYLYANSGDVTLTFTGTAYTGNGEVTLVKDDNADFAGWNLVGNPFAQTAYISKPFYTTNLDGTGIIAGTGNNIEAMEGIFVIANTDGETMTFSMEQRDEQNQQFALNVNRNRGNIIDRAIVRFNDETTLPKFMLNRNSTKLYIPQDGEDYAIVCSEGIGELPLNFVASENGTYSISVDVATVEMNYLHLIDNMTGADIDLLQTPSYTFEANTTDYASRFRMVFAAEIASNEATTDSFAYFNNSQLIVANQGQATLQVVDLMGHVVKSETINNTANIKVNAAPGVYLLRLMNGDNSKTQKIVIQ